MKQWILLLTRIAPRLEKEVGVIEKRIEKVALSLYGETINQYSEILTLTEQKSRLINVKVLCGIIRDMLSEEERKLLFLLAKGESYAEIGKKTDVSTSCAFKRISKICERVGKVFTRAGWGEERLCREFSSLPIIRRISA